MGSSTSVPKSNKVESIRRPDVDQRGFPLRGSIKSISSFISEDDYNNRTYSFLEIKIHDHEREIDELKRSNLKLRNDVQKIQSTLVGLKIPTKPNHSGLLQATSPHLHSNSDTTPHSQPIQPPDTSFIADIIHPHIPVEKSNEIQTDESGRNLPRVGDHVVSMWGSSKWQYFTATIVSFDKSTLKYTIEWDDNDPTGTVVDYYNLALDKVPSVDQVGVGSTVLFHQAKYVSSEVRGVTRSAGLRWHQGEIDRIYTDEQGIKLYDGHHTKGEADGKWSNYKDYSYKFTGYQIEDFRMPPNVFDILDSAQEDSSESSDVSETTESGGYDVFLSYAKINCPSAINRNEISGDLPPSYEEAVLNSMCDPRDIANKLNSMGVRVFVREDDGEDSLLEIVTAMKRVKVFIACLSDEYASNDRCRMEFQYAKKTLKLPVIPLVVGAGSFQWQMTVVGLLIAGDLYIHFKNKEVEGLKMTELATAIKTYIPKLNIQQVQHPATGNAVMPLHDQPGVSVAGNPVVEGEVDFFFSYCWNNSNDAVKKRQVSECVGNEWNDPRTIVKKLSLLTNLHAWLDVERLGSSAGGGLGMFGQIATAMNECKVVIACVSTEYANSDNCRMEFQFAVKSLQKPVLVVVVGEGNSWKESAVGKIVHENLNFIDFQNVHNLSQLEDNIKQVKKLMQSYLDMPQRPSELPEDGKVKFRAPVPGDHVVCLHQRWAYFLATINKFDEETLTYTVNWDDGDPTGREQSYKDVALDVVPTEEIGVGSIVLFAQGSYSATTGNNTGGVRYHQGKITRAYIDKNNISRFDGEHTKSDVDGKMISYHGYEKEFFGKTRDDLRLSPNAMDALMACKTAYTINN